MHVAREAVLGAVLVAMPFKDEAEAIGITNDSRFAFAGAVLTNNVSRAHRVAAQVNVGTFWINGYKTIHVSSALGW